MRVAALGATVVFFDGFDTQVIGNLNPAIAKDWQLTGGVMKWVGTAGLVGLMLGALTLGPLADRVGRRAVIIGSTLAFGDHHGAHRRVRRFACEPDRVAFPHRHRAWPAPCPIRSP